MTTHQFATDRTDRMILVGFDGSEGSQLALDWAIAAAVRSGTQLTIAHTLDLTAASRINLGERDVLLGRYNEASTNLLEPAVERARAVLGEGRVYRVGLIGSASAELLDAGRDADVIVVGSRTRGRFRRGLLGSTAFTVAAHSRCPVVVIRAEDDLAVAPEQPGPDRPVVVGHDGSRDSARAVEGAAKIAADSGATLKIVHAAQMPSAELFVFAGAPVVAADHSAQMRDLAQEELTGAEAAVRAVYPDLAIETVLVERTAAETLVAESEGAGLLVVGSRGLGGFTGLVLGSVSHAVIHRAACPVMVIK